MNDLRWEVCFVVYFGCIVDNHCLNYLCIIYRNLSDLNDFGTNIGVLNKQVIGLYRLRFLTLTIHDSILLVFGLNRFLCINKFTSLNKYSEWLLLNANLAIFYHYHGENKLIFNQMMMMSTVYDTNCIFLMLAHWNHSPRVDMSHDSDTLSWFWANQSLLLFLSVVCLAKKQQIPIS